MSDAKEKRKQGGDAVVPGSQKKVREVEEGTAVTVTVTDDEVEEFYAIVRRINTAVKYFKSGGDDVAAEGTRWRASLEKEIMQEVKGATKNRREEDVQKNLNLDLNVTPQPE